MEDKVILEIIDMEDYFKIAEQVVDEIFERECERGMKLVQNNEKPLSSAAIIDGTRSVILQVTLAICSRIERDVLLRIQKKDRKLLNINPNDEYAKP